MATERRSYGLVAAEAQQSVVVDVQAAGEQESEAGRHALSLVHPLDGARVLRPGDDTRRCRSRATTGRLGECWQSCSCADGRPYTADQKRSV